VLTAVGELPDVNGAGALLGNTGGNLREALALSMGAATPA
jgi:hypothetical protein